MKKRPLSPHLAIYKPMITSTSSILGRFAGVYIYLLTVVIGIWIAFTIQNGRDVGSAFALITHFSVASKLNMYLLMAFTFGSLFAFFLYILALVRHIIWDFGYLLNLKASKIMGWGMFISAFLIATGLEFFIFFV